MKKNITYQVYVICDTRKPGGWSYGHLWFEYCPVYVGMTHRLNTRMLEHYFSNKPLSQRLRNILESGSEFRVDTVWSTADQKEACAKESEAIALIGRSDLEQGPLFNRHSGGQGADYYTMSKAQKLRYKKQKSHNYQKILDDMQPLFKGVRRYYDALGEEGRKLRGQSIADKRKANGSEVARGLQISQTKRLKSVEDYRHTLKPYPHFKARSVDVLKNRCGSVIPHKCEFHGVHTDSRDNVVARIKRFDEPCKYCRAETFDYDHPVKVEAAHRREECLSN